MGTAIRGGARRGGAIAAYGFGAAALATLLPSRLFPEWWGAYENGWLVLAIGAARLACVAGLLWALTLRRRAG